MGAHQPVYKRDCSASRNHLNRGPSTIASLEEIISILSGFHFIYIQLLFQSFLAEFFKLKRTLKNKKLEVFKGSNEISFGKEHTILSFIRVSM
jgi:hypothetical protein